MSEREPKLSKTQQELLDAINSGVVVQYMPYLGSFRPQHYYFRLDNHKRCTSAADTLRKRNLVRVVDRDIHGHCQLVKKDSPHV